LSVNAAPDSEVLDLGEGEVVFPSQFRIVSASVFG